MMLHQHFGPSTSLSGNSSSALQNSALSDGVLLSHSQQPREELKRSFETREGVYRVMTLAEYSRPRGQQQYHLQPGLSNPNNSLMVNSGAPVRVSFLTLNRQSLETEDDTETPTSNQNGDGADFDDLWSDKLCFNIGKELYIYHYRGTHTAADLARPIDKRVYKGTAPTVHCFNQETAQPKSCSLVIGFSTGQLQIIDPLEKSIPTSISRLYNEDRTVDKTAVTCLRWVPGQPNVFLASYASGNIYVYNEDVSSGNTPPIWNILKHGDKFSVYTCKSKTPRNPVYRWHIGDGAIHQFNFSGSDGKMMATVGHDGFLRIFDYHSMELLSVMKSYFGGLLSLSWSPDAKLIATGGEDDLLTVYSVQDKRVVCRGQGHKSWISQVKFDHYCCTTEEDIEANGVNTTTTNDDTISTAKPDIPLKDRGTSTTEMNTTPVMRAHAKRATPLSAASTLSRCSFASFGTINGVSSPGSGVCYRIGSVGHDTQLCLWDVTEDMLKPANVQRHRNSTIIAPMTGLEIQTSPVTGRLDILAEASPGAGASTSSDTSLLPGTLSAKPEKPKKKRFHRRGFTLGRLNVGGSSNSTSTSTTNTAKSGTLPPTNGSLSHAGSEKKSSQLLTSQVSFCEDTRLFGSKICPKIQDVPVIEPLMCKKIAHERLTVLEFRQDCIVTACQEGYICTWARPGKAPNPTANSIPKRDFINSPGTISPESGAKVTANTWGYSNDYGNGVPARSPSSYSTGEQADVVRRSPNTSPSYRVTPNNGYHRTGYNWQNVN